MLNSISGACFTGIVVPVRSVTEIFAISKVISSKIGKYYSLLRGEDSDSHVT